MSQQIQLISITTTDLFTDQQYKQYTNIVGAKAAQEDAEDEQTSQRMNEQKRAAQRRLNELIKKHTDQPRTLRIANVVDHKRLLKDEQGRYIYPAGITWQMLKATRRVAQFASQLSRAMGLGNGQYTYDKIIIKWKNEHILKQIVLNGFYLPILHPDGSVQKKHMRFVTASAGQLRTDKIQCISDDAWNKIERKIMCGLSIDDINRKGGINVNKLMAYMALSSSATDPWPQMDIDKCIVINDFESPVTGLVDYISNDYKTQRCIKTTDIKHSDGCGMVRKDISESNFMVRGGWIKGLLASFDYLQFCNVNHVPPVLTDLWGKQHNLIEQDIQVIFTKSQFKLWKYYDDWDHYKKCFKQYGCMLCRTNYEEQYIADTEMCYQFLQTLQDFSDEQIEAFTKKTKKRIESMAKDPAAMLTTLKADEDSADPYKRCLTIYPQLLRDAYAKESLKSIKRRWTLDAKSGKIKCKNKRLFAIPDLYAACEYWFMGNPLPRGLLRDGQVACKIYRGKQKVDCLRSPHLYFEHTVRHVVNDDYIYHWFYTNGIYTSCHDLISKVLQFDVDGDQLNVVAQKLIVDAAERNIQKYDVVPLLYDLGKAGDHEVSQLEFYQGLKRAHEFSGIGQVSNRLTKLWNKPQPDRDAAGWLCYFNNLVIDAAKTGFLNTYANYPQIQRRIGKATGGKRGRMPYFFQFSKNGRKMKGSKEAKIRAHQPISTSTMDRICQSFDTVTRMKMSYDDLPPFNWQMLLADNNIPYNQKVIDCFCDLDTPSNTLLLAKETHHLDDKVKILGYDIIAKIISERLVELCGSVEQAYPTMVRYLFAGGGIDKATHKQMFWRVFGDIAYRALLQNLHSCTTCTQCGMKIPNWSPSHSCAADISGFFYCVDCGILCQRTNSKQHRCAACQTQYNKLSHKSVQRKYRQRNNMKQLQPTEP